MRSIDEERARTIRMAGDEPALFEKSCIAAFWAELARESENEPAANFLDGLREEYWSLYQEAKRTRIGQDELPF